jgi:hypothetical protein
MRQQEAIPANQLSRRTDQRTWWTASVNPQMMRALERNPLDFANVKRARTSLKDLDLEEAISKGYASTRHEDGGRSVWVFLKMEEKKYDLVQDYWKARQRGRIELTAHGRFWNLPHGDLRAATGFWRQFGPLGHPIVLRLNDAEDEYSWFDLGDFWNKLRRFRATMNTWIMMEDLAGLRTSWIEFSANLSEINEADVFPFGSLPIRGEAGSIEMDSRLLLELGNSDKQAFQRWLDNLDGSTLRRETAHLIACELNARLGGLPRWHCASHADRPGFDLALIPGTLWSAMWYLFALDTRTGVGPRICPNHEKLFYPPRRDRFYCTTEEQTYHSRLNWWERNKETELEKRRAARREQKTLRWKRGARK